MKKIIFAMLIVLCLTGCFAKKEDALRKAIDNNNKLNNYYTDTKIDLVMENNGSSMTVSMSGNTKIDIKNKTSYSEMTSSFFGVNTTTKSYTEIKDDKKYTYTEDKDTWLVSNKDTNMNININNDDLSSIIVLRKEKENTTYDVKMKEDKLKEMLNFNNELTEKATIDFNNVKVNMTVKDKYVSKIYMEIPYINESAKMIMKITFEYSKFNEIGNITIPDNIIENAIDKKTKELKENAQDYMDEAEYEVWGNTELENKIFTNVNLEYDGVKPSKVELTMEGGFVLEGIIELEGYRATFKDSEIVSFEKIK